MGVTTKTFSDGGGPDCLADDQNGAKLEPQNFIEDSGQTHSGSDREQMSKAASIYAGWGDFFTDTGAADAYVFETIGGRQYPTGLTNGFRVRGVAANTNTGASTLQLGAFAAKALVTREGKALSAGMVAAGEMIEAVYFSASDSFWLTKPTVALIQDFTVVGDLGDTGQFLAGRVPTLTEINALLSNGSVLAMYNFADGALTTDEVGTYTLTNNNAATNTTGIVNTNYATYLDGVNQYYNEPTLLDNPPASWWVSLWMQADDGQPAANSFLVTKINDETVGSRDYMQIWIDTAGKIRSSISANQAAGASSELESNITMPNGPTNFYHIVVTHDATYGHRFFIDTICEKSNPSQTTIMSSGTTRDFTIGCNGFGGVPVAGSYFAGKIAHVIVGTGILVQRDIKMLAAATIPIPASLQGENFIIDAFLQPEGDVSSEKQTSIKELQRYNNMIYLQPWTRGTTDKLKAIGRIY